MKIAEVMWIYGRGFSHFIGFAVTGPCFHPPTR